MRPLASHTLGIRVGAVRYLLTRLRSGKLDMAREVAQATLLRTAADDRSRGDHVLGLLSQRLCVRPYLMDTG